MALRAVLVDTLSQLRLEVVAERLSDSQRGKDPKVPNRRDSGIRMAGVGVRLETAIAPVAELAQGLPFYPTIRLRRHVNRKGKNTSANKVPGRQAGLVLDLRNHILVE